MDLLYDRAGCCVNRRLLRKMNALLCAFGLLLHIIDALSYSHLLPLV